MLYVFFFFSTQILDRNFPQMMLGVIWWAVSVQWQIILNLLQQRMAQEVLTHLKEHPDAWTRVDTILEFSQNMNTKVSHLKSANYFFWWVSVLHWRTM